MSTTTLDRTHSGFGSIFARFLSHLRAAYEACYSNVLYTGF